MRFLPLLCLLAQISQAQVIFSPVNISNIATDDSGQTIYFSTPLRLRGSNDNPWAKIYLSGANGFHLFSQSSSNTNGMLRNSVSLSAGSKVIAVNSVTPCVAEDLCATIDQSFTDILMGGTDTPLPGTAQVSRGGRYVMLDREIPEHNQYQTFNPPLGVSRLDLTNGSIAAVPSCSLEVASDGTCLGSANGNFVLISPTGTVTSLGPAGPVAFEKLAADGSFVIYGIEMDAEELLAEIHIRRLDGSDQMLAEGDYPTLSADGSKLLYLAPVNGASQAFLLDLSAPGSPWQLTSEPHGITEAFLSGDGSMVAAATPNGGMITVQIQTGVRTVKIGATPIISLANASAYDPAQLPLLVSSGSTYSIAVTGAASQSLTATPPLGVELDGVSVVVDAHLSAMYSVSPSQATFQVAWGLPTDDGQSQRNDVLAVRAGDPNWEAAVPISGVYAALPQSVTLAMDGKTLLWAIHGDSRGLVSSSDPAIPGEIVYFYATGLGPPLQPVATGVPGPVPPIAIAGTVPQLLIASPCQWLTSPTGEPLTFLFAGLAPGIVGYYQVNVLVPADYNSTTLSPSCGNEGAFGTFPVNPAK